MGVYVFRCLHGPWCKVGHHRVTPRKPNAYYRIAGRGFYSVVHPPDVAEHLGVRDMELVGWFPNLDRRAETRVHRACDRTRRVGEFHPVDEIPHILCECAALGGCATRVTSAARRKAIAWGARRAAAARRRRARKGA